MMSIFQYFTPKSETFYLTDKTTIRQALEKFDYHKFTVVPLVSESGEYLASISVGDVLRYIKNDAKFDIQAAENVLVMDLEKYRSYEACTHDVKKEELLELSLKQNFVPIVDDRNLYIGIFKRGSIVEMLLKDAGIEVKK